MYRTRKVGSWKLQKEEQRKSLSKDLDEREKRHFPLLHSHALLLEDYSSYVQPRSSALILCLTFEKTILFIKKMGKVAMTSMHKKRTESTERWWRPHIHTTMEKRSSFQQMVWELNTTTKISLDRGLIAYTKINSKWIWDLNIKHLEVSNEENWDDLRYSSDFLAKSKTWSMKETSDSWILLRWKTSADHIPQH